MLTTNKNGFICIPSEMIEDKLTALLGDWLRMYHAEQLTFAEMEQMMRGVWWFLSKNGAIHAEMAWNNETDKIKRAHERGLLKEVCNKAFSPHTPHTNT